MFGGAVIFIKVRVMQLWVLKEMLHARSNNRHPPGKLKP